ncbi:MAG: prepilin-type N-terminal cleavage/methylation domain-containing protein [Oribacterium sp.]|nr:prepilin-type N-terminal cleavage/methylation domain-containing protein [Oribacterium sp.]
MKRITGKKGFTLAELLIVVAIIGVLVAISIPIFTSQLKKARLATNQANARAAYAAAMAWYFDNISHGDVEQIYKDGGMYDVATGVFTPGINVPDGTKLVADITTWKSEGRGVADRRNAGEQVYKKWDVYWSDAFDGTVSMYIAHD